MSTPRITAPWWLAYFGLVAVHLAVQLFAPTSMGTRLTQVFLAPLLILALARSTPSPRTRIVRWTMAALVFCFLGDLLPGLLPESVSFLAMVGAFLVSQILFIVAFAPWWRHAVLAQRPGGALAYGVVFLGLVVGVGPHAGPLLVPVVIYGATLTAMALLSTGIGRRGAVGGLLFFVSDALIAINTFAWDVPASGFVIMATYTAALALLVAAVVALPVRPPVPNAVPSPSR